MKQRPRINVCAACGYGATLHRAPAAVVLLGRLVRWMGAPAFVCRVCASERRHQRHITPLHIARRTAA